MKCFIIFAILIVSVAVKAEDIVADSESSPSTIEIVPANREKKQEKRGIGYNSLGGYSSGLGVDSSLGYNGVGYNGVGGYGVGGYNGGIGGYSSGVGGYSGGLGGYNSGYYSPYTPPRVAGLGSIGYSNPSYYNNGYNSGYNSGYSGFAGYSGGYPGGYSSSRLGYPYSRQGYYNSYPSSYYNSNLGIGSSIVGGGLGLGGLPATVPVVAGGGYQYGPGISGGIY